MPLSNRSRSAEERKKKGHDGGRPPIAPKLEGPVGFFPPRYLASPPLHMFVPKNKVKSALSEMVWLP
jgi:hypothetical protein